jgi:hypothetical protein
VPARSSNPPTAASRGPRPSRHRTRTPPRPGPTSLVGAVQGPSMMPLPHRLPRSEIGWQVPPWATRAEPPRDAFQYQTMVTESVAPLVLIRWHHRFDSRPELIRNHTHSRHRSIVAGQRLPIRETRPSRASFLCMLVLRRQVLLQSAVAIVLSQCPWLAACPAANSFRWSPLAELQEAALGSGTTRPWSTRSHAEMRETSPLTTIAYRGCRHTDPPDSSNVTPAQHQMRALGLKLPRPPQCRQPLRPRMKGRRVRAATFSRASGA